MTNQQKKDLGYLIAIFTVLTCFVLVGNADYDEAVSSQGNYCKMVKDGYWPDYKHTYKKECN